MPKKIRLYKRENKHTKPRVINNNAWCISLVAQYAPSLFVYQSIKTLISVANAYINVNFARWILNSVAKNDEIYSIILLIIIIMGVCIFSNFFLAFYTIILLPQKEIDIGSRIRERVIKKVTRIKQIEFQNTEFYDRYELGLREIDSRSIAIVNNVFGIITFIFELVVLTGVSATISGGFALFGFFAAVIDFGIGIIRNKINYKKSIDVVPDGRKRGYVNRIISQPEFLADQKIYAGFSDLLINKYQKATNSVKGIILLYAKKTLALDQTQQIPGLLLRQTLPWIFITFLLHNNKISVAEVTVLAAAAISIPTALTNLLSSFTAFHINGMYAENLRCILEYQEMTEVGHKNTSVIPNKIDFQVKDLNFSYILNDKNVLKHVSMEIPFGTKVAIVGGNGAGKSTLLKLLMRLYDTKDGEILVNNKDIKEYDARSLRSSIAYLTQDYKIYSFSLAENVLMRPITTSEDRVLVEEALKKVGLWEKVKAFSDGIDTYITREFDAEGEYFSGGELQKLALARVYACNYQCIILDESTSALDSISEDAILKTLLTSFHDRTIIFVSHRLNIVNAVDCVFFFSEGELKDSGKHLELLQKNNEYADFYLTQANKYSAILDNTIKYG